MLVSLMQFVTDLTPPPQLVAVWAEERGFAGLYVPEKTHVPISRSTPWPGGELPDWYRRCYDPVVALAAAAAVTTRLRVGTGACLVAVHDPILLAKQIASLCAMSGERFVLGVGFGWNVEELADHGVPFADRIAVTVDKLAAMRALWAAEPVHYEGTHASVPPSWAWPKPAVAPPVRTAYPAKTLRRATRTGHRPSGSPAHRPAATPAPGHAVRYRSATPRPTRPG